MFLLTCTLQLPADVERQVETLEPDAHGLTVLPFFAGERSPGYHGEARATVAGWNLHTAPAEIVRACFEGIAYRLAAIYELVRAAIPAPGELIASGAALLNSPAWVQILADVLGQPVTVSGEADASARGAALLALEALGASRAAAVAAPAFGQTFFPNAAHHEIYLRARARQEQLYSTLIKPAWDSPPKPQELREWGETRSH